MDKFLDFLHESYGVTVTLSLYLISLYRRRIGEELFDNRLRLLFGWNPPVFLNETIRTGDVAVVEMFLRAGVDPNNFREEEHEPLSTAASNGLERITELLLEHGAIQINDGFHWTASMWAAHNGHHRIAQMIDNYPINRNRTFSERERLVFQYRLFETIRFHWLGWRLIYNPMFANIEDPQGRSPLHHAVYRQNVKSVQLLLDRGANPNMTDREGQTPLSYASANDNYTIAKLLIDHGASVNESDHQGRTPLTHAFLNDARDVIHLLLEHGAEDSIEYLRLAADNGDMNSVRRYLSLGAIPEEDMTSPYLGIVMLLEDCMSMNTFMENRRRIPDELCYVIAQFLGVRLVTK